jgi:TP901 family phage tail tape measure protein
MGKSSGSLWLSLGIRTEEFSKGLKRAQKDMNGFQKFGSGLKSMFNPLTVGIGAIAGVGAAFGDAIQTIKGFDQAMADVSAITGATGDDLKAFRGSILKVADSTGKGGEEIAKAFQMVGSAQPELLKSADALGEVTKQAVILSQAGGMDVPAAADALTKSMNQFGVGADKAAQFIDILASSQQMGTATIGQLADSMVKAGGTARAMGMNFEQSNVMLQLFAKGGVTGAEAGTQMAGVLSKLAKVSNKEFNPTQTDALQVIKNLKNAQLSYTDLIKMTDSEGAKWITTLINQADAIDSLDGKLNNQGAALEQANTRTATIAESTEKLSKKWDNFIIGLDGSESVIGNAYKSLIGFFDDALTGLKRLDNENTSVWTKLVKLTNPMAAALDELTAKTTSLITETQYQANITKNTQKALSLLTEAYHKGSITKEQYTQKAKELRTIAIQTAKDLKRSNLNLASSSGEVAAATDEETESVKQLTKEQLKQIAASKKQLKILEDQERKDVADEEEGFDFDQFKLDVPPDIFGDVEMPDLRPELEEEFARNIENRKKKLEELAAKTQLISSTMANAFSAIGGAVISAFGQADSAGKQFLLSMGQMVIDLMAQALAASMANAITGATGAAAVAGPFAPAMLPATIATMVGAVIGAFAAIPAFADGGIISGPTVGLMGEYKGARNNPEVISPLDKLQSMMMNDGGMGGEVRFRIEGTTLVGVLEKQHKSNKYSR